LDALREHREKANREPDCRTVNQTGCNLTTVGIAMTGVAGHCGLPLK
jgi:hypothetical protein